MTLKEVIELEGDINKRMEKIDTIYLIRDSENSPWYKAYNWSAYLMEFYPNEIDQNKKLKPVHKIIKSANENTDIIYVGLQLASFKKYIPNVIIEDETNSNMLKIKVDLSKYDENILNINSYENWLKTVEIKEINEDNKNKKENKPQIIYSQPTTFTSIMRNILKCDVLNLSGEEAIEFINFLKLECTKLI